ncbi:MAG: hypothetical protein MUE42_02390 [Opitutaceae bacterium]|nr:hypothetical protein [Opitutaceae bacterium]
MPAPRIQFPPTTPGAHFARRRGGVLIVALLVSAILALVLGSYLSLNLGTARLAQRTFDRGAAFHLAEAGLEEGLWTYNRLLNGHPEPWSGWRTSGGSAWRRLEGFTLSHTTSGDVKIYASPLQPTESTNPILVSLASVRSPGGAPVTQMIETTLKRRSFFAAGLVARDSLVFRGRNTTFDSWNSDPDSDPATPALPYQPGRATDTGSVATGALDNPNAALNQARIHGYFHTSGLTPDVGSGGFIGPFGVAPGTIDPARLSFNFSADFPAIPPPAGGTLLASFGPTLGTLDAATSWRSPALQLSGSATLTILGDVTLVLTEPTLSLRLTGNAAIIVPPGSSLTLYVAGDVAIGGRGLLNQNPSPASFQLWSTEVRSGLQTIQIFGNGALSGVLYAPEAEVTVVGNGDVAGAIVARRLTFTGNAAFHYDLALARLHRHAPYRADGWRTLDTPEARARWLPLLDP